LENGQLTQKSLADGLGLPNEGYVIFRDGITNLEYIRSCREIREQGLYVELGAYKCHTFLDWRFVESSNWGLLNGNLNGAGVESVQRKWDEMFGVKDESGMVKDEGEEKIVKRKTKKAAATLSPKGKKHVAKKPTEKMSTSKKTTAKKTVKEKKVDG
jgi:hypothetical protein